MSIFLSAYVGRTSQHTLSLLDQAGDLITIDTETPDRILLRIFRTGGEALVEVSSFAATAAGSTLTLANPTTLVLGEGDLDLDPGAYDCEAILVDGDDDGRIKHADTGVFMLHGSS